MTDHTKSKAELIRELNALRSENQRLKQHLAESEIPASQVMAKDMDDSKTILIVDDNEHTRLIVGDMVTGQGYAVVEAATPEDAIERISAAPDTIDLILSDIVMPGEDGPDMVDQIMKINPGIKVIFMSGYAEEEIVHDAVYKIQDSNAAFIKKPFSPEQLESLLRKTMNQ